MGMLRGMTDEYLSRCPGCQKFTMVCADPAWPMDLQSFAMSTLMGDHIWGPFSPAVSADAGALHTVCSASHLVSHKVALKA